MIITTPQRKAGEITPLRSLGEKKSAPNAGRGDFTHSACVSKRKRVRLRRPQNATARCSHLVGEKGARARKACLCRRNLRPDNTI